MGKLTRVAVDSIMRDCLYRPDEVPSDGSAPTSAVIVEGAIGKFGLHPVRLASYRDAIAELLAELPDEFQPEAGGWSFLQACVDRHGEQWGEHRDINALFVLAIGVGLGSWCLPREMWYVLPGGMPYFVVKHA